MFSFLQGYVRGLALIVGTLIVLAGLGRCVSSPEEKVASALPSSMSGDCPLKNTGGTSHVSPPIGCLYFVYPGFYRRTRSPDFLPASITRKTEYCAINDYDIGGTIYEKKEWLGKRKFGLIINEDVKGCLASIKTTTYEQVKNINFKDDLKSWQGNDHFTDDSFKDETFGRYVQRYRISPKQDSFSQDDLVNTGNDILTAAENKFKRYALNLQFQDISVSIYASSTQDLSDFPASEELCRFSISGASDRKFVCNDELVTIWRNRESTAEGLSSRKRRELYRIFAAGLIAQVDVVAIRCRGSRNCQTRAGLGKLGMLGSPYTGQRELAELKKMTSENVTQKQIAYILREGAVLGIWRDLENDLI